MKTTFEINQSEKKKRKKKENRMTLQVCGVTEHMVPLFSLRKIFCSFRIILLSLGKGVCHIFTAFVAGIP